MSSLVTFEMTSTSPVLTASSMRLNVALLLVSWAVDMWFLLGRCEWMLGWLRKSDLPVDRRGLDPGWPHLALQGPGPGLRSLPECQDARGRGAAVNSVAG